ncbi:MAG TPA: chemotaxis protein CheW [Candidatus Polarisedimenticolia bacterium]|nr:chemotaxis protein CheW [Candidatus Polarisedimenticolia bacterium]
MRPLGDGSRAGGHPPGLDDRAADMRRHFDESFALAPKTDAPQSEDFLVVRIAGAPFALRRIEVSGLLAGRKPVKLPNACHEFLGIVGFRGLIVPVYSLRVLLGYPRHDNLRWAVLAASGDCLGLAFDEYEGYLRIPSSQVAASDQSGMLPQHVRDVARHGESARPVLDISSIVDAIRRRIRPGGPSKER